MKSKSYSIELSDIRLPSITREKYNNGRPYVNFGDNNLFPQELIYYSDKSVTHAACLNLKKLSIAGNGYTLSTTDPGAKLFLDNLDYKCPNSSLLEKISADLSIFNGFTLECHWNIIGTKVIDVYNLPFETIRISHPNRYGESEKYYYNYAWDIYWGKFDEIDAFDPIKAAKNGQSKGLACDKQILYTGFKAKTSLYPIPEYKAGLDYIANEYELAKHYLTCTRKGFLPAAVVTMFGDPTPEEEQKTLKIFEDTFTGAENSSKVMLNFAPTLETRPVIDTFNVNKAVDTYQNSVNVSKEKIIMAHGVTNGSLVASGSSGTSIFGNGDELRASLDYFYNTRIKSYHTLIENTMNMVLKYAGYPDAGYKIIPFSPITNNTTQQ